MANNNEQETRNGIDNLNDSLSGIEQKVENNQKIILWVIVGLTGIIALILIWLFVFQRPSIENSNNAIGQADLEQMMGNDSLALKQYQQVADEYGHDAGNRANLNAAIILYKQGKYQEALDYVKNYKGSDAVIAANAKALEGDCYVNLDNLDEAISCFKDAVKISDNNPALTPVYLMKLATVYNAQKNYTEEAKAYQTILDEYPAYGPRLNLDLEKYVERANELAGANK